MSRPAAPKANTEALLREGTPVSRPAAPKANTEALLREGSGVTVGWRGATLRAVLFDLDGTLADTAGEIAAALNRALAEVGAGALPPAKVRAMIGRGAPMLVTRALTELGAAFDAGRHAELLARFHHHAERMPCGGESGARPYPGAAWCLAELRALGIRLAVVTNKNRASAFDVLRRLSLLQAIDLVVGGDSCARRKPDPEPLRFACEALAVAPSQALMVGDSVNDVLAARAAGLPVLCVPYGYNEGNDPRSLACDAFIENLADLPGLLTGRPLRPWPRAA